MKVCDLVPGDLVEGHVFVGRLEHPIWPSLQMVIWRMSDGSWSHDALALEQEIGELAESRDGNSRRLRSALIGVR